MIVDFFSQHSKYNPRDLKNTSMEDLMNNVVDWWGGIDSSVLCGYIKTMCPCIDTEASCLLMLSLNDIYKHFYHYDLLSDIDEMKCGCKCGVACDADGGETLLKNPNLDRTELYLIRTVIQLYCKLGIKRMLTLEDLENSGNIVNGLLPSDFNFTDLAREADYKYPRRLLRVAFYRGANDFKDVYTIGFYTGTNGVTVDSHYINFYIGDSTQSALITPDDGDIFPNDNTEWVDAFIQTSQDNMITTTPANANLMQANENGNDENLF